MGYTYSSLSSRKVSWFLEHFGVNPSLVLRVEFSLKTDSGYPKDTGFTLFTLATPGTPLCYNTQWSAPPVSALTHSRGPRRGHSHQSHVLEHRDTYGQAQVCSKGHQGSSVDCHVSRLFIGSSSGMYGIRYLRVFDYISVS